MEKAGMAQQMAEGAKMTEVEENVSAQEILKDVL